MKDTNTGTRSQLEHEGVVQGRAVGESERAHLHGSEGDGRHVFCFMWRSIRSAASVLLVACEWFVVCVRD